MDVDHQTVDFCQGVFLEQMVQSSQSYAAVVFCQTAIIYLSVL